jgi:hypothetical protein
VFEPELLVAVKLTVFEPAVVYVWLGFWTVEVSPSPKSHCQEVGLPTDVSVNCTDWPASGKEGLKVKAAVIVDSENTVTVRRTVLSTESLLVVRATL